MHRVRYSSEEIRILSSSDTPVMVILPHYSITYGYVTIWKYCIFYKSETMGVGGERLYYFRLGDK